MGKTRKPLCCLVQALPWGRGKDIIPLWNDGAWRSQVSARGSGPRGRRFKSARPDSAGGRFPLRRLFVIASGIPGSAPRPVGPARPRPEPPGPDTTRCFPGSESTTRPRRPGKGREPPRPGRTLDRGKAAAWGITPWIPRCHRSGDRSADAPGRTRVLPQRHTKRGSRSISSRRTRKRIPSPSTCST
jgi:hypothetical protein